MRNKDSRRYLFQWILILSIALLPLITNLVGLIHENGMDVLLESLSGNFKRFGLPYNPWPSMLGPFTLATVVNGVLAWVTIFIATRDFPQKRSKPIGYLVITLCAILGSMILAVGTRVMDLIWLPQFGDYLLGLPGSEFIDQWSMKFVFPAEFILLFIVSTISSRRIMTT